MSTTELPDIPGLSTDENSRMTSDYRAPKRASNGASALSLFATGFIAVVAASAIAASLTLVGKDAILAMVGVAPAQKKEDVLAAAIEEQQGNLQLLAQSLDEAKAELKRLSESVNSGEFAVSKLEQRVTTVERFASSLDLKIGEQKKAQQIAVVQQKKAVAAKPKAAPIIPLTLVSIRTQAGMPLVALRDGLDKSELLMPGDSWRGWTFLDADAYHKSARFQVGGKVQELRL